MLFDSNSKVYQWSAAAAAAPAVTAAAASAQICNCYNELWQPKTSNEPLSDILIDMVFSLTELWWAKATSK